MPMMNNPVVQVAKRLDLHGHAPEFWWQDAKGVVVGKTFPLMLDALKWASEQGYNAGPKQTLVGWVLLDDDNGDTLQMFKLDEEEKARAVATATGGVTVKPMFV